MGFSILRKNEKNTGFTEVTIQEIAAAAADLNIRLLALRTCVSLIANAVGKCEFQTFRNRQPVKEREYYMLNIEPNINQNSTMFWHEFIYKLCTENGGLAIATKHRSGHEMLVVADSWEKPERYPAKQNEYKHVRVGSVTYDKTFREHEVLHVKLNHMDIHSVLEALYTSYSKLISAAEKGYRKSKGDRLKVKVTQVEQGTDKFSENFQKLMENQVKAWVNSDNGVLPEFEGYQYSEMGKERTSENTRDIRALVDDIFTFTARGFCIPPVLVTGDVADTKDAVNRWLTACIDPLCDQIEEELIRKRYGYDEWIKGNFVHIDTTTIQHFDLFSNAASVEKLIGSGAFSINDVLAAAGLPEIDAPWAKRHWLTKNFDAVEAAARAVDNGEKGGNGA
ncbi:MAG: phage portal protein [Oscillospiraceae bacterium]|nr:phage portal protein [Oscillospiraceae bacterium]